MQRKQQQDKELQRQQQQPSIELLKALLPTDNYQLEHTSDDDSNDPYFDKLLNNENIRYLKSIPEVL